jgi:hypothetical protein
MDDKLVQEMLGDHSRNPRNYGELQSPDVEAEMTNPQCVSPTHPDGDRVSLQVLLAMMRVPSRLFALPEMDARYHKLVRRCCPNRWLVLLSPRSLSGIANTSKNVLGWI